jgi:hypothetical protein
MRSDEILTLADWFVYAVAIAAVIIAVAGYVRDRRTRRALSATYADRAQRRGAE